ncbi:MAG: glycoside hydrolase family 20 zincin-like fold domain-containing protein [Bryobacterales bacterium]|nr:glycoside hydrolase family 20 zincin-like fold domain-containing protein [Bryobacterales bacterium]
MNKMSIRKLLLICCLSTLPGAARVIPTPQFAELRPDAIQLKRSEPVELRAASNADAKVTLAADLIRTELKALKFHHTVKAGTSGAAIVLWDNSKEGTPPFPLPQASQDVLDEQRYFGQSYVLETRPNSEIWIIGSTAQGVLNGAATFVQLVEPKGTDFEVAGIRIRDYPSFRYRAASDWLLRAELNRWAYDWGDGIAGYTARIRRKLDFCTRFKINMVIFDGFGWSTEKRPGYAAMMRMLNEYARKRGIKLLFAGYGANFNPNAIEPEFHIGKAHVNRRSYPDGEVYSCFGEDRSSLHPTYGTCRSNDALQRQIAGEVQNFVRAVEPGALYIHHEDTGHYETTQWRWDARCEECKRRWPNPDFAASDGGAGAMAHGYSNIFKAVQRVKNRDTGYDASKDCTVAFISPLYGVDSQRSGLGSAKVDPELNWNKTLEFWANAVARMPRSVNLQIGLREIFPNPAGQRWMDAWQANMQRQGLSARVFMFFLGGADQYTNGVFNYPFTGNSAMNGMFDGAETIYNFNGGLHQEPQQVINAEYSWNSNAPGRVTPANFADGLRRWNALMSNEEMPEAVFGPGGVFQAACARIYGKQAGASMARFFNYHEERQASANKALPAFYPHRLYPYIVLWRFLQGDAAFSNVAPSAAEQRELNALKTTRVELQRNVAELWRQNSSVNLKARKYLDEALQAKDLRTDAREDVEYLRKCLVAGQRFADLLAGYHGLLASDPAVQTAQVTKLISARESLASWLHREFRFDFTDPKGGDQAAWLETLELLRTRLQEVMDR